METKIQEVQEYFKNKIINGQFELTKTDQFTATILIDEKYIFNIWIPNGGNHIRIYSSDYEYISFMDIKFSKEEKELVWDHFKGISEKIKLEEKKQQFEQLKKELYGNDDIL